VAAAALRGPVILTQHKKARLIVLSVEEYELRKAGKVADTRTVGRLATMPDELFQEFERAVAVYERGDDEG